MIKFPDMPEINWARLNFPPGLNQIHYNYNEQSGRIKKFSQKCYLAWFQMLLFFIFNFTSNLIQCCIGEAPIERLLQSILHSMIFIQLGFYVFYKGYRTVAYNFHYEKLYVKFELVLVFFYLYILTYDVICYNGLQRIILFIEGSKSITVLVIMIIEWLFQVSSQVMRIICLQSIKSWAVVRDEQYQTNRTKTDNTLTSREEFYSP